MFTFIFLFNVSLFYVFFLLLLISNVQTHKLKGKVILDEVIKIKLKKTMRTKRRVWRNKKNKKEEEEENYLEFRTEDSSVCHSSKSLHENNPSSFIFLAFFSVTQSIIRSAFTDCRLCSRHSAEL